MKTQIPVEARPGLVLFAAAATAIVVANSPLSNSYETLLSSQIAVGFGPATIEMPLTKWIKNALMAGFFYFVGLELKRELLEGQLSRPRAAALPVFAAIGGVLLPALAYLLIAGHRGFGEGWAIPAATDIAFALGVLSLFAARVPVALRAFLLAVAVVDDLAAILIIAVVYTSEVSLIWLGAGAACLAALVALNRMGVARHAAYASLALPLWVCLQNSGVNPTLAGVMVAAATPMRAPGGGSPLIAAEHAVQPWVMYLIMPIFALTSAGVSFSQGFIEAALHPVALGAAAGLALGKPLGIALATFAATRMLATPAPGTPAQMMGVGCLAGIGFTMSLFIGGLAFPTAELAAPVRVGVYLGSIIAGAAGALLLMKSLPPASAPKRQPA